MDCGEAWRSSESETHAAGRRWIGGWKKLVGREEVGNGKREKTFVFFEKDVFYAQKVPTPETFLFVIFFC